MPTNVLLSAALLLTLSAGADAAAAPPPRPPPKSACQMALDFSCGAALSSCSSYPCAACEACVLGNQTALSKAGCTSAAEITYCSHEAPAPPVSCIHTDSRGDTYDLGDIPKVDGEYKTVDGRNAYYHVGLCGSPTLSSDPAKGCLSPCAKGTCSQDGQDCDCGGHNGIDEGGEAVCQWDGPGATNPSKETVLCAPSRFPIHQSAAHSLTRIARARRQLRHARAAEVVRRPGCGNKRVADVLGRQHSWRLRPD